MAAVAAVLKIRTTPSPLVLASGLHGGGGASRNGQEWIPTGCLCGALAAGVLAIGILYGTEEPAPKGQQGCASQVAGLLHRRFQEEMGAKCCNLIRPFQKKTGEENSCKAVYRRGAELTVDVLLSAPDLLPDCGMPGSLRRLMVKGKK